MFDYQLSQAAKLLILGKFVPGAVLENSDLFHEHVFHEPLDSDFVDQARELLEVQDLSERMHPEALDHFF